MTDAFTPIDVAGRPMANRIVMAPMTRSRAYGPGATATDLMAAYYSQRASAGLIVTEGIQPSPVGQGYPDTPGLHSPEQVAAWRKVTDAVHREDGVIFAQLMHTGRIGHPSLLPPGLNPLAPSPVAAKGQVFTHQGPMDFVTPQELDAVLNRAGASARPPGRTGGVRTTRPRPRHPPSTGRGVRHGTPRPGVRRR
jgi:N-ethylmaleimide reductase